MEHFIGLRTVKTGIAVTCTILVSKLLGLQYPFYAIIATIISMDSSISASFTKGKNRILGTTLGAIIGTIAVLIEPESAILTGIAVIIVISICNKLNWNGSIVISGTVVAIIMFNLNQRDPFLYALSRLFDTFIGIVVALAVNFLMKPQDYEKKVIVTNLEIHKELDNFLDHIAYDVIKLEEDINRMKFFLSTYDHELTWTHHYQDEINLIRDHFRCYDQILLHLQCLAGIETGEPDEAILRHYHERKARTLILRYEEEDKHESMGIDREHPDVSDRKQ